MLTVGILLFFVGAAWGMSLFLPSGFIPTEDQGYMFLALQLPDGASAQRTDAAQQKITSALLKTPGIEGVIAVTNFSLLTQVQSTNAGFFFVALKPWETRKSKEQQLEYIQGNLQKQLMANPAGIAFAFPPPPGSPRSARRVLQAGPVSGLDVGHDQPLHRMTRGLRLRDRLQSAADGHADHRALAVGGQDRGDPGGG